MQIPSLEHLGFSALFFMLDHIERAAKEPPRLQYPPTFQIGPPRGGTTLIRLLIGNSIPTSHLSNLTRLSWYFTGRPLPITTAHIAARIGKRRTYRGWYESEFGKVLPLGGPAECEVIWNHWFDSLRGPVGPGVLSAPQRRAIYNAVAATERGFGLPFLNKTSVLALRIRALTEIFPDALFIRTHRDPIDTAQSILRAQRRRFPQGIGACPAECINEPNPDAVKQVCRQVFYIEQSIDRELRDIGAGRFLDVAYAEVCSDPRQELRRIATFLDDHGVPAPVERDPPRAFANSHGLSTDPPTYNAIIAEFDALRRSLH